MNKEYKSCLPQSVGSTTEEALEDYTAKYKILTGTVNNPTEQWTHKELYTNCQERVLSLSNTKKGNHN